MKFKILALEREDEGAYFPLTGESLVGRSQECQIKIADAYASRKHCRFIQSESTLHVEDMGSMNGTYVNSKKINNRVELKNGDLIIVGNTKLIVVQDQEKQPESKIDMDGKMLSEDRPSAKTKAADALKKLFENR